MERNEKSKLESPRFAFKKIPRLSLLFWSILLTITSLVYGYFDSQGRSSTLSISGFLSKNWRHGLTFSQTIWDPSLFWGEIWFNIGLALIMAAIWMKRLPSQNTDEWKSDNSQNLKFFYISISIIIILLVGMLLTELPESSLFENWYPTHMSYQLPIWPAIIASILLITAPMKKYQRENGIESSKKSAKIGMLLLFTLIWIIMVIPTEWDIHSLTSFEVQIHTWLYTMSIPVCIFVFILTFQLKNPPKPKEGNAGKSFALVVSCLLIFVVLQLYSAYSGIQFGESQMFSTWILWWWPFAHWPGWIFSICLGFSIVLGSRIWNNRKISQLETNKESSTIKNNLILVRKNEIISKFKIFVKISCVILILGLPIGGILTTDRDPPQILINQLGYLPMAEKRVIFQTPLDIDLPETANFSLINSETNNIVYNGTLENIGDFYQHYYMEGNFSDYKIDGKYYITTTINGNHYKSRDFFIGTDVYDLARERAVQFYYYQRCGYDVENIVDGFQGHKACHLDDAMVWNGTEQVYYNLTGGWHDAGDYNKYNSWYHTQWFCVKSLNYAWRMDNESYYEERDNLYDSISPDILDESLWGATFLVKCVDRKGLREGTKGLVFNRIVDWNYKDNRSALMSYSGPPDQNTDNIPETGDERVVWDYSTWSQQETIFASAEAGYGFAGALLETARLIDDYKSANPEYEIPAWAYNTTVLRETAALLNQTYYSHSVGTHIYALTTRHYYETEAAIISGDFTNANASADAVFAQIDPSSSNWIHSYALSRLLDYYSRFGFEIPTALEDAIETRISEFFDVYYVGPFRVVNGMDNGELRLFGRPGFIDYHGVINYDMFSHMYLQSLIGQIWPEKAELNLIQYELDYLFGMNPLALCQMDGVGGEFVNQLHHRYAYADNPSGRIPGGIINGIVNIQPSKDWALFNGIDEESRWLYVDEMAWVDYWEPSPLVSDGVDSNCNEIWIPHNAVFLELISYYTKYYL